MTDEFKPEMGDENQTYPPDLFPPNGVGEYEVDDSLDSGETAELDGEVATETEAAAETQADQPTDSLWVRLRRAIYDGKSQPDDPVFIRRMNRLTEAIEIAPDSPANYILRGEMYLKAGLYEGARADFQMAVELASDQYDHSNWGHHGTGHA